MHFHQIINAAISNQSDRPLMQKEVYPVSKALEDYLRQYKRDIALPITYQELHHYQYTDAIKDQNGKHTHWESVTYQKELLAQLQQKLIATYALLKQDNNITQHTHQIKEIDYCEFANSMPFRITISSKQSSSPQYYYIKSADASRMYGLELEQLLSPNQINFLYHQNTLVEEHIEGIPGDSFLETITNLTHQEQQQIAEEFVRFNERSFARLLGDMRSYNFVVLKTETNNYRIKAIDFDQQSYEGKLNLYLPQFYKENYQYVQLTQQHLTPATIEQIRHHERQQIATTATQHQHQLAALLQAMQQEEISENYKVLSLKKELNTYFNTQHYTPCQTMGAIVKQQLKQILP